MQIEYEKNLVSYYRATFRYQILCLDKTISQQQAEAELQTLQEKLFLTPSTSIKSFSQKLRDLSVIYNWWRLFIIRIKRVVDSLYLTNFVLLNSSIAYLAWVSYIPRLVINLVNISKNILFNQKLTTWSESWTLFKYFIDKRWFELANDSVWFSTGLITCFVASAATVPYILVFLYTFDVLAMYFKNQYYRDQRRENITQHFTDFEREYQYKAVIDHYLHTLERKDDLALLTTILLLAGMILCLPVASFGSLPFIGASLVVLTCIYSYWQGAVIESEKASFVKDNSSIIEKKFSKATLGTLSTRSTGNCGLFTRNKSCPDLYRQSSDCKAYPNLEFNL